MKKLGVVLLLMLWMLSAAGCTGAGLWPQVNDLESLRLSEATMVFDSKGRLIAKLFEENRTVVSLNHISPYLPAAMIANEDSRFYQHAGVDPLGIIRALWVNIKAGQIVEGGSTITQQLVKNLFLNQERTLLRKIKEFTLALVIEQKFSKQEILEAYLNQVYFGEGAYGAEAAAQLYFGKHAAALDLAESALLAGLPRGPALYSPYADLPASLQRRQVVLAGMVRQGYITAAQAKQAGDKPVVLAGRKKRAVQASYFLDYVAASLVQRYGSSRVYQGGMKVYTTLDNDVQQAAEQVLGNYQGAVLAIEPRTGYIRAMVGGRSYEESQLNRAVEEVRQPGSAFKPFVYAAALQQGLTSNALIVDQPVTISGYAPQNYDRKYRGPVTLKKALRWSVNTAAVKLGQQVGMEPVLQLAKTMGITTLVPEDRNLAAALGGLTRGVTLLELSGAYGVLAGGGILSKPLAVLQVLDSRGRLLEENHTMQQAVLGADIAYIMTNMLQGVIQDGTGTPAGIGRPAAGKTGTTDNYETAWFIGYTPELVTGIYIGNDDRTTVGISGTQVAALWGKMMTAALAGRPVAEFVIPANVVGNIPVCANSGQLATAGCPEIEYSAFIKGTEPPALRRRSRDDSGSAGAGDAAGAGEKNRWWNFPLPRLPSL